MTKTRWQYAKRAPKEARTGPDGFVYDSKTEMRRGIDLQLLERAGEIRNLKRQETFPLSNQCGIKVMAGDKVARYTPDFCYEEKIANEWFPVVEDVKGYPDEASKLRIRVYEALYGQKVTIVKKPRGKPWTFE